MLPTTGVSARAARPASALSTAVVEQLADAARAASARGGDLGALAAARAAGGWSSAPAATPRASRSPMPPSHRIPYAMQEAEQLIPASPTRLFSRWSREIYLGFPEAARRLRPGSRTAARRHRQSDRAAAAAAARSRAAARARWGFPRERRAGAARLRRQPGRARDQRRGRRVDRRAACPTGLYVIWATGEGTLRAVRAARDAPAVRVRAYLSPIADAYAAADLALARAGAMTTAELCAWGIPAMLVPLPTAAADHQSANARALRGGRRGAPPSAVGAQPGRLDELSRAATDAPRLASGRADELARPDAAARIAGAAAAIAAARLSTDSSRRGDADGDRLSSCTASSLECRPAYIRLASHASPRSRRPPPDHFVGIAGAGMSALAELFVRRGARSPAATRNPAGAADLARLGVHVAPARSGARRRRARRSSSRRRCRRIIPELVRARELGIPVIRRAEALGEVIARPRAGRRSPARTARRRRR